MNHYDSLPTTVIVIPGASSRLRSDIRKPSSWSHSISPRREKSWGKPQEIWRISGKTWGKCLEKHGEITNRWTWWNLEKSGEWIYEKSSVKQGKRKYWEENDGNIEEKRKEWGEEWGETGRNHQKTRERIGWNPRFMIGYHQAWNGWNPLDQVVESPFFQDNKPAERSKSIGLSLRQLFKLIYISTLSKLCNLSTWCTVCKLVDCCSHGGGYVSILKHNPHNGHVFSGPKGLIFWHVGIPNSLIHSQQRYRSQMGDELPSKSHWAGNSLSGNQPPLNKN